ncbi:hypothetical protein ABIA32_002662 [Streptacidiphilus sp. MAP12-20]|uniref:MAB_1171c family putative transporter n=1 Tax=Streptacidiphilus sp. MAP12-20 TaxID=3156299 RepID=UPI003519957E
MIWFVHIVMPVVLVAFSIWGMPSARGTRQQRALIGCFAFLATALVLGMPAVIGGLDGLLGVTSITTILLEHLAIIGALACLTDFVYALYGTQLTRRLHPRYIFAGALSVALTVLYVGFMPHNAAALDYSKTSGRTAEIAFLCLFYLWMVYVGTQTTTLLIRRIRQLRQEHQRPGGIVLLAAGCLFGGLFGAWRTAYMIVLLATGSSMINIMEQISELLMTVSILLLVAGAVTAPISALLRTIRAVWALNRLARLWADLTECVPHVVLGQPPLTAWAQIRTGRPNLQLRRRAVEIRDAALTLAGYAPEDLHEQATAAAEASGARGDQIQIEAEALWIRAALDIFRSGAPARSETARAPHGDDVTQEIKRLVRVAAAYGRRPRVNLVPTLGEQPA